MSKPGHAPFGWRQAVLLLIGFNVVVFLASLVIGFVFGVVSAASTGSVDVSRSSIFYSDGYVVITQTLAELIAAYWAYRYVRRRMAERWREGASTGVGWLPAPRIAYVMAVIMATILTAVFCVVVSVIPPEFTEAPDEAFTYFIALEGVQWSSAVMILTLGIMTPFIEELLFRGAALAGFSESLGPRVAVVLVTIIFVVIHASQKIHYLQGFVAVGLLASSAIWLRMRYRSIFPSIILHSVYNVGVVVMVPLFI